MASRTNLASPRLTGQDGTHADDALVGTHEVGEESVQHLGGAGLVRVYERDDGAHAGAGKLGDDLLGGAPEADVPRVSIEPRPERAIEAVGKEVGVGVDDAFEHAARTAR